MDDGRNLASRDDDAARDVGAHDVVIRALGQLLRAGTDEVNEAIDAVLGRVGIALSASVSCLYLPVWQQNEPPNQVRENGSWRLAHAAFGEAAPGGGISVPAEPVFCDAQADSLSDMPVVDGRLEGRIIADTALLPDGALKQGFLAHGVQAALIEPLIDGEALVGILSVMRRTQGSFTGTEHWVLQTISDGITAALMRAARERRRRDAFLETVRDAVRIRDVLAGLPEFLVETDAEGRCIDYHLPEHGPRPENVERMIGSLPEDNLPPPQAAQLRRCMERARGGHDCTLPRFWLETPRGPRWYEMIVVYRPKLRGQEGFVFRVRDVTDEYREEGDNNLPVEAARQMSNLVTVLDADQRIVWANAAVAQCTGRTLDTLRGRPYAEILDRDLDPETHARVLDALARRESTQVQMRRATEDGGDYWAEIGIRPLASHDGSAGEILVIENEITGLKRHETELSRLAQEAETAHGRLHAAIEALQDGFALFDADDRLIICNERYRSYFPKARDVVKPGSTFEEIIRAGTQTGDLAPAHDDTEAYVRKRLEMHREANSHLDLFFADGRCVRAYEAATPDGGRVGLRVDITALKQAEQRLSDIIESAQIGTWEFDIGSGTTEINEYWWQMLGYPSTGPSKLNRALWESLIHADDNEAMKAMLRDVRNGVVDAVALEIRLMHHDGHWVSVLCRGRISQRKSDGEPVCISGIGLDLTQRRRVEERLRTILDASSVGTWELDCKTGRVSIDEQYAAMLGYKLNDLLPWNRDKFEAMVHPEDLAKLHESVANLYGTERMSARHEFRIRHREGHWIWVMSETRVQSWAAPGVAAEETGVHIDITERKLREAALSEAKQALETALDAQRVSQQRYTDIADASDEWFWEIAPGGLITHLTSGFQRTTQIPASMFIGRTLESLGLLPGSPNARGDWEQVMRHAAAHERFSGLLFCFHPPRRARPIWLRCSGGPFYDADGNYAGYRGVGSNVTELIATAERAEAASEAKSRFLANMSHELRTPLTGVLGMTDLLGETPLSSQQRDMISIIRDSGEGLLAILNDILDLAKIEAGKMTIENQPFVPKSLADRVKALFGHRASGAGLSLITDIGEGCEDTRIGDANRMLQILHNLVGNAIKFTRSGSITLSIRIDPGDANTLDIVVEDTGIGMSEKQVAKVFDEFEQAETSTARRFGGTGLGLSITRRLTELMGGDIHLESEVDRGTKISLRLPAPLESDVVLNQAPLNGLEQDTIAPPVQGDVPSEDRKVVGVPVPDTRHQTRSEPATRETMDLLMPVTEDRANLPLTGMRLLVADDNATNRTILEALLAMQGAEITLAEDGQNACELYKPGAFHAVLLDISMPVIDGIAALQKIRAIEAETNAPPVPALAVTANAMQHQIDEYFAAGFVGHVPKPFRKDALTETLAKILNDSPDA
ncbi:PAS domain S-box protein [Rhodobacter sp. NTK016B]|uniref:PAS domain S-box protein n=1 Tax=Rhodobacter sp. NTK016B TaxID=2759676 RepID=UPI001A8D2064|nr:PAS domain S-box protein [Rhodobacter sp. NTK016B]MBN8294873.1 PAS domain S-box protein [Rhodobacter sp. NTK016B]